MAGKRILVVDDDIKTVELVKLYLARDGHRVFTATDGIEALGMARSVSPDLIVLDIMLPGMDGLQICSTLREESDVPIILLTARTTESDRLVGLNTGADDYVTKPFSPRELAARVRAVLRRIPDEKDKVQPEIVQGDLRMNFATCEASVAGEPLDLTPMEFKLLGAMAREPGIVFSRSKLIDKVFHHDFDGFDRTVDVHIRNLRRKLEPDSSNPRYIKTVYGSGYKFVGDSK